MTDTMRAVAVSRSGGPDVLTDVDLPVPTPGSRDLLVEVRAVSVNPVDTKVRAGEIPAADPAVLGYDAAGVVTAVGDAVSLFSVGDEVWYAGSVGRPGTNATYHLVDEHFVAHKPSTLSFAEAAAMPLTTITAWETLFERFRVDAGSTGVLLVQSAAGGVGSVLIQLARALTGLTVIGTASRPESQQWARDMGAQHVVDHSRDLVEVVREVAPDGVDLVFSPRTAGMIETYESLLRPGGAICAIDEPEGLELLPLKSKSISFHWELMFTKPLFSPEDSSQHEILDTARRMVETGALRTTMTTELSGLDAATLQRAHEMVEDGHMVGKVVLTARER